MTKAAIIFSRMDSHRLPGKALMKIGKEPLLAHCIQNTLNPDQYDTIVATSDKPIDDEIADLAKLMKVKCFRGSASNINQRVIGCIQEYNIDTFARVNGDSPFVCSELLVEGFEKIKENDLVTNLVPRTFPYGVSVEVFKSLTFIECYENNEQSFHPENITSFFYDQLANFRYETMLYSSGDEHTVRLTVDTHEDLNNLRSIYDKKNDIFESPLEDVVNIFKGK